MLFKFSLPHCAGDATSKVINMLKTKLFAWNIYDDIIIMDDLKHHDILVTSL